MDFDEICVVRFTAHAVNPTTTKTDFEKNPTTTTIKTAKNNNINSKTYQNNKNHQVNVHY